MPVAPVVVPPRLLADALVPYPEGGSGDRTVILVLVVSREGTVESAEPDRIEPPFSDRAVRSALGFRFEPATRDGVAVRAKLRFEVVFRAPTPEPVEAAAELAEPSRQSPAVRAPPAPIELEVRGVRPHPARSASLTRAEVRELPGAFGDPFRAIEALPGVTPIVSGLPFFFVRGAPPGNVGYFLDGVRVPLLFHVGIGPSVVHPALVDRVDLYPSAYPTRFGRFAGGIVSGETLAPSAALHGEYNLRLFDVGALVEVPFASGKGAALAGGRYSYTAALLSLVAPETVLAYWDYQARLTYALTPNDRLSVFAFGSYDYLGEQTQESTVTLFGTEFHRVDARYDRRLGDAGALQLAVTGGIDRSVLQRNRSVRTRVGGARAALEYRFNEWALFRGGADVQLDDYEIDTGYDDLAPGAARVAAYFPERRDTALGVRADVVIDVDRALVVTPGVRVDSYASDGAHALAVEPRLALRARASAGVSVLASLGIAHQPPSFVLPVPGLQPGGLQGGLQRALQESLGLEFVLGHGTTLTATVFQNAFFRMSDPLGAREPELDGCAPGAYPMDTLGGDVGAIPPGYSPDCGNRFAPGTLGPDRSGGPGHAAGSRGGNAAADAFEVRTLGAAYGLELLLKRKLTGRLGGFIAYTLSRSVRSYARRSYVASFDRTHVLNVAALYDLGRGFRAGARVLFYTGLPKAVDPTDPGATRLPAFFRLDVRGEKRWRLGQRGFLALVVEWMNATLAKEAVSTSCTLNGCKSEWIGPVTIPSLGLEGGF